MEGRTLLFNLRVAGITKRVKDSAPLGLELPDLLFRLHQQSFCSVDQLARPSCSLSNIASLLACLNRLMF